MRVLHRVLFAALAIIVTVAVFGLIRVSTPQTLAQAQAESMCGGYRPPCPATSGTSVPPSTRPPVVSVPSVKVSPTCGPGQTCETPPAVCPPNVCLPVTGSASWVTYGIGICLVIFGVMLVLAARRKPDV